MPTEYNYEDSLEKYTDVCANLNAHVTDCDTPLHTVAIVGLTLHGLIMQFLVTR